MTITAADIKLLESERMTDTSDGGGRRTSRVIADGVAGNIFPKVSRSDSVYGRINLRKVFGHVDTPNVDTYAGAHVAIIDAPDNDRINVNLFTTGSDFDDRTAARDRIESYVVSGPESRLALFGRQLQGQQAVTCLQRVEEVLPEVGEVYCLSAEAAGVITAQQYIRIDGISHEVRNFTDQFGDFSRRVVTLKISAPLRTTFVGQVDADRFTAVARPTLVRSTTVADAARYYGITPLEAAALQGSLELRVASVYSPLVPSTQREAAVSNVEIGGASALVPAGSVAIPFRPIGVTFPTAGSYISRQQVVNVGTGIVPGSLRLQMGVPGVPGQNGPINTDDGKGSVPVSGQSTGGGFIPNGLNSPAKVDYASGAITVDSNWGNGLYLGFLMVSYIPAVAISQAAHSIEMPVTLATRGTVQVVTLNPAPAPGTVFLDYRALGKWYRLRDDGTGQLTGDDPAYGAGQVTFQTGALVATIGALPDVGSSILVGWGSQAHYQARSGATSDADTGATQALQLTSLPAEEGSLQVKYTSGGVDYTAQADLTGAITGGGIIGTVNSITGAVQLRYTTRLPDPQTAIVATYQQAKPGASANGVPTLAGGNETISSQSSPSFTTHPNIRAKGLRVSVPVYVPGRQGAVGQVTAWDAVDNGAGALITVAAQRSAGGVNFSHAGGVNVGTVDLVSGAVTINYAALLPLQAPVYLAQVGAPGSGESSGTWATSTIAYPPALGDFAWTARLTTASAGQAVTQAIAALEAPLQLDLTKTSTSTIVPGSLWFTLAGRTYFDRAGVLYHSMQADGSGTEAGTVDYQTGTAAFTDYAANTALGISVSACLTQFGKFTTTRAAFRTAGSPLRPASTFVQALAADGELLTATCSQSGVLSGDYARGQVNQQMGLVSIEWGSMVVAAGNESQPWYKAANVVGGQIFKPREVMPATIRYNTVVLSNLPMDADILGVDPVRLPLDGRVPIFRPADILLVHHTADFQLPNPPGAGVTYSVGRGSLADLVLLDAKGARVPASQYVADLVAGTVTMAADMNLIGLTLPLRARNRIEQLSLASDVQINGQIGIAGPLARDFPLGSMVSSTIPFGDLFARVTGVFDQVSFTGVWQDSRIGSDTPATFDTINFPIQVRNDGAVTERWRAHFLTANSFQIIGENLGIIGTGTTAADCALANPLTGKPYFTIKAGGWGIGWAAGNQLRFNTIGATASIWMARTVLPGATLAGDSMDLQLRGDVDA